MLQNFVSLKNDLDSAYIMLFIGWWLGYCFCIHFDALNVILSSISNQKLLFSIAAFVFGMRLLCTSHISLFYTLFCYFWYASTIFHSHPQFWQTATSRNQSREAAAAIPVRCGTTKTTALLIRGLCFMWCLLRQPSISWWRLRIGTSKY